MFKELRSMILGEPFKILIYENKININSYDDILLFDNGQVLIKIKNRILKIKGEDLTITRLENNEVLVEGKIKIIDLGD